IRTTPGLDWAASNERTGHGILDGIQRIAGGYSGPVDVPLGSEFRPASGLSPTTGESRPSHKDVAAKRLRGPGRDGLLERIGRYSEPPTLWDKIYHNVFGSWPTRTGHTTGPGLHLNDDVRDPDPARRSGETYERDSLPSAFSQESRIAS